MQLTSDDSLIAAYWSSLSNFLSLILYQVFLRHVFASITMIEYSQGSNILDIKHVVIRRSKAQDLTHNQDNGQRCFSWNLNICISLQFLYLLPKSGVHAYLKLKTCVYLCCCVQVTSPYGNQLHFLENVASGQFAFTTQESGNYMACFWMQGAGPNTNINVALDWKTGVAAKDWASIAKKDKLDVCFWVVLVVFQYFCKSMHNL